MLKKLNLGCGHIFLDGYINLEGGKNVLLSKIPWVKKPLYRLGLIPEGLLTNLDKRVQYMWLPSGLKKFGNASADRIFSSHFIEHVSKKDALFTLQECFRILCPGGLLRIVAPDAILLARSYVINTEACIREGKDTDEHRELFFHNIAGGYVTGHKNSHRYMWDIPSIKFALAQIGFQEITVCSYQNGRDPAMCKGDNYPEASFFVEAIKP